MKKTLAILTLVASAYSMSAQALFTRCEIDTRSQSLAIGAEFGGGYGQATCWDAAGEAFRTPLNIALIGAGLELGICDVTAHYSAVGVGFALDQILTVMGQVEVAPINGQGGGFGVELSPFGINGNLTISRVAVANCWKLADIKGIIATKAGPTTRYILRH